MKLLHQLYLLDATLLLTGTQLPQCDKTLLLLYDDRKVSYKSPIKVGKLLYGFLGPHKNSLVNNSGGEYRIRTCVPCNRTLD